MDNISAWVSVELGGLTDPCPLSGVNFGAESVRGRACLVNTVSANLRGNDQFSKSDKVISEP